ncbi:hypothetical protein EYF80_067007 [Liparis tanakae]|uniref:Uncharacterized protein n=1 Tax=Liparis tanakae TaxID=230148 RepID=A0A4Z2E2A7_9TELE|nr:hypothetical protein EYF80_067007 [Liparis tanakae]
MLTDAVPSTCLRAAQSRDAISRLLPARCGMKYSVQVREDCPGIRLEPAESVRCQKVSEVIK